MGKIVMAGAELLSVANQSRSRRTVSAGQKSSESGTVLVTRTGLLIPEDIPYEDWERAGQRILDVLGSSCWCLGDWLVHGEARYADRYRRAIDKVGLDYQTMRNYAWVARRFDRARRRAALSFQHHMEVARFAEEEQDLWLTRAEQYNWSRNELRRNIRAARGDTVSGGQRILVPSIRTEPDRLERWREAAQRCDISLQTWIIEHLDAAASVALTD
jgi:hypothetical protein